MIQPPPPIEHISVTINAQANSLMSSELSCTYNDGSQYGHDTEST
ncbi:hypothetical protein CSB96_0010 [Pseudomonas aeruginosa]|nr:hypothetical protein CSB96_0010 [Pseudomonas aeruginosa]